ncbi:VWA domain-containing protein [Rhizobium esperanzae]|uniref:VWA domain-containing protein n=1 Tax=Rhizobium esperanzae TaxID=1967781 RepID=A0A7W6W7Z2_9HYPH|nr:VWA domain-containing protein [Rhizobium esperanzae]MBB4238800.1 hypothetical protein [Rhizobium esperanzae]
MGMGRFSTADWAAYNARHVDGRSRSEVFGATGIDPRFDPSRFATRESRDSAYNPQSTPIILASDVTGSMGMIAHELMRGGLITLTSEIYDRRPVSDPHIMVAAVGDADTDVAPLQATQFEADISLASQIRALWLEGNGGGNDGESYSAAHLLAALKTSTDAFERRGRKGYLFTIGDEPIHNGLTAPQIARIFGIQPPRGLSARECLAMAERSYEVFHIVIREGYAASRLGRVLESWQPLLPGRTFVLDDYRRIAELVVSIIEITEGRDPADVAASWPGAAAAVVAKAIGDRPKRHLLPFF